LRIAWGTGIITGLCSNTFAEDKHINMGVNGGAGVTKFVELMPNKNDSTDIGLCDSASLDILPGLNPLPAKRGS
jgi:hypothetical protein